MEGVEDLIRLGGSVLSMRVVEVSDNQCTLEYGHGNDAPAIFSQVANLSCGLHSSLLHGNILPHAFKCENGVVKCLHLPYSITLEQLLLTTAFREVWKPLRLHNSILFWELTGKFVNIIRGVLRALLCLLKQGKRIGRITAADIVFCEGDTEHERPQIIDCLITGRDSDDRFSSVADLISDVFTSVGGNTPSLINSNPVLQSFIRCLRGESGYWWTTSGMEDDKGPRYAPELLLHPFFQNPTMQSRYIVRLRDGFRFGRLDTRNLEVSSIMGNPSSSSSKFGGSKPGWGGLFHHNRNTSTVMLRQFKRQESNYDDQSVPDLIRLMRDGIQHGGVSDEDSLGRDAFQVCPRLLSYLFEIYGTMGPITEELVDV